MTSYLYTKIIFFNDTATTEIYTLSLHDALPIFLLTMCDNRTNLSKTLTEQVEEMFQKKIKVFQTKIPKTVKVGESIYSGQSIKKYAKGSSVDIAYDNLAKEICYE